MEDYIWDVVPTDETRLRELIDACSLTRPTALVLACRKIEPDKVRNFLFPVLSNLGDPYDLPGTEAAARRLWEAILQGEKILIHGDYDTDGITATALLAWVLRKNGADVECFLPHRIDDGYGLTAESIEKAHSEGQRLLVTVDCGITSYEAAQMARQRGIDLIVTDHHMPGGEQIPAEAVVDPKLPGSPEDIRDLAGVGVAFKVCHAFLKYARERRHGGEDTDLREAMDLVALGTVADIVPLLSENRTLVRFGLKVLSRQQRPGIHALCEIAGVQDSVATSDITYRLAPRINATGRMGDPTESLRLLEADSMVDASGLARSLDEQNRARQQIEEAAVSGAEAQIEELYDMDRDHTIVVWNNDWHQGVVGIVASRLTRHYYRPSVVLTRDSNGYFTGSARSIRRVNLVELLEECGRSLVRFGGHAMAAGLSLSEEALDTFRADFEAAVSRVLDLEAMKPQLDICGEVPLRELSDTFFTELELLEPFGHGNPEPVFMTRRVMPDRLLPAGRNHTRGTLEDHSGGRIGFIAFRRTPDEFPPPPWDLVYTPQLNRFNGNCVPQVRILDVQPAR